MGTRNGDCKGGCGSGPNARRAALSMPALSSSNGLKGEPAPLPARTRSPAMNSHATATNTKLRAVTAPSMRAQRPISGAGESAAWDPPQGFTFLMPGGAAAQHSMQAQEPPGPPSNGTRNATNALEMVGPWNLPQRLVERGSQVGHVSIQSDPHPNAFESILTQAALLSGAYLTPDQKSRGFTSYFSDDDDGPPPHPQEPATTEDCEKWFKEYLEWLNKNDPYSPVPNEPPPKITLKCGNHIYVITGTRPNGWSGEHITLRDLMEDAIGKQGGLPGEPGGTKARKETTTPDQEWGSIKLLQDSQAKDSRGRPIATDLTGKEGCLGDVHRVTEAVEGRSQMQYEFAYTYVVADLDGKPDRDQAAALYWAQTDLLIQLVNEEWSVPDTLPSQEDIEGMLLAWPYMDASAWFTCIHPCYLEWALVSYSSFSWKPNLPAQPTEPAYSYVQKDGYWEVTIRSLVIMFGRISAIATYDFYCRE